MKCKKKKKNPKPKYECEKKMRYVVLPIFDGVIMDGHPIFWVVDAGHHDLISSFII